jgi:acetyl-CoA carboxylase biotin carboxyl carrier protein
MAITKNAADALEPHADSIDTRLVRKLASILKDTGLSEIEVERGDLRIRVVRAVAAPLAAPAPSGYATVPYAPAAAAPAPTSSLAPPTPELVQPRRGDLVKSPMVGTVYLQAQPGAPAFVKAGDRVEEGQTLMIVEAMKTMNPIPAPRSGVVSEILVEDNEPVEYGAPLVVLE